MNQHHESQPGQGPPPPPPHAPAQQQQQPGAPPPHYGPPPAERSGGTVGTLTRLGGLLTLALLVFLGGFYVALFVVGRDPGPARSVYKAGEGRQKVAIIPISGMIDNYTSRFVHRVVEAILEDDEIRAVVLRVESPGGGATASDEILHSINRLRNEGELPVIASYGDYAASGGYYVSCQTERIFAQPTSVTGSIGVIAGTLTVEDLLQKLGIEPEIITSSLATEKDFATPLRSWTEEDRENMRRLLDSIQEQFIRVIVEGRAEVLDEDEVRELATGRVFTAQEAYEANLIDELGYISDAINHAVELGDFAVDDPPTVIYRPRAGLAGLLGVQTTEIETSRPTPARLDSSTIRQWADELSIPRLMYLWQP